MRPRVRSLVVCAVAIATAVLGYSVLQAAITIPTASAYTQNFDSIGTSATATLPADFRVDKVTTVRTVGNYAAAGTTTTAVGGANLSSTASNGIYNFGAGTTTTGPDRAVGFLSSGSATQSGNLYAQLANNSGSALTGLNVSYNVEKYRAGTNSAGFRIQLFYSFDGSTWLSAGSAFTTAFTADAGANTGYATAPGVTVPVNQTLTVAIPNGSAFYLAWNYSVASGSTTTNAQALAIDDISITGIAGAPSTAPLVTSTSPTNGAGNVPVTSTVVINFDQSVSATATAFQLACNGTAQAFTQSTSPANTFTLTPASPLPLAAVCTVTVVADQITEAMTANYTFSFVTPLPSANAPVVISQVYGGGGNNNAVYLNDFVELYNRSTTTVDLTGWSIQYASSAGSSWGFNLQTLGGPIAPGQYLLISLASGGANGSPLPQANIYGQINMSATAGKVALVNASVGLTDSCPFTDPHLIDFVGYGGANCGEGGTTTSAPSNSTAVLRKGDGATDTNNNNADFVVGDPTPRQTAPFVEFGPSVVVVDPTPNTTIAPKDATMTVTFSEPVDVTDPWFDITCPSGKHNDATTAVSNGGRIQYITPNDNFVPGEKCTATIYKNQVADQDLDDSAPDTNNLKADFVWSFTIATGGTPPDTPDVHLAMGNPSGADATSPDNYLMEKPEYALSYDRALGRPNWVSWHLTDEWTGNLARNDTFRPDPAVPPDWYRVQSFDFSGTGFDRGHMTPNADRDNASLTPNNQATFLMTNMVAQAPDNNQGPWANFENYLRSLLPADELYIVSGPLGVGGVGSNGYKETVAADHVAVPAYTWKVALVLPKMSGDDVSRIDCSTRTIAVLMPNVQGIRTNNSSDWMTYLTTVDDIQTRTGYNFFSNVPGFIQNCIEAGINGVNPKNAQSITFDSVGAKTYGDGDFTVSASATSGLEVSFALVSGPATLTDNVVHLTGAGTVVIRASQGGNVNYNAAPDTDLQIVVGKAKPSFGGLGSLSIEAGTPSVTASGTIAAGALIPSGTVTATVGTTSVTGAIAPDGGFTLTIPTGTLAATAAGYTIGFTYGGDANFTAASATSTLTVVDTTAPALTDPLATPGTLGPVNHKLIPVAVNYTATDFSGATCGLTVGSNEPVNGLGDGNTSVDWQVIDPHHVVLRSERSGLGSGRIYTILVTCTDPSGNATTKGTVVTVPK